MASVNENVDTARASPHESYDAVAADFVCSFMENLPTTATGKNFSLYDWQKDTIREFYGAAVIDEETGEQLRRYWYLYLELPKKNGKSETAAGLGLYHLIGDGELNAEVYVVAADKENAGIIYSAAVYMATTAPWLAKMVANGELKIRESTRTIVYRRRVQTENGGFKWVEIGVMKVLSSEAYSKHGYKPSCVIFDELHAQKNRELWDVMTFGSGSGRKQPVYIVLTTAGDDPDRNSIGWEIHEKAVGVRDARELRKILAEGGDPRQIHRLKKVSDSDLEGAVQELLRQDLANWLPVLFGITAFYGDDPDDLAEVDIWDEALWYRCNPSLGKHLSIRTLRLEAEEAKRSEAGEKLFRWLRLNQWISVKAVGWLPLTLYDKLQFGPSKKAEREVYLEKALRGKTCYGGVDLSSTTDLTAFVLFFPAQPGLEKAVWLAHIWRSGKDLDAAERRDRAPYRDWERAGFITISEGDVIDFADVENAIAEAKRLYRLEAVGFDPYLSRTITQRLESIVQCIEIPQDMKNMSPAMKEIETGMLRHEILHTHNSCYRWTFGNVRCAVDGNENKKPMKNKSPGRIDPAVATITAVAVWMIWRNRKPDLSAVMQEGGYHL